MPVGEQLPQRFISSRQEQQSQPIAVTSELSCCSGSGRISDGNAEKRLGLHPKRLNKHLSQHAASIFTGSRRHGWSRRPEDVHGSPGEGSRDGNDPKYQSEGCFQLNLSTEGEPRTGARPTWWWDVSQNSLIQIDLEDFRFSLKQANQRKTFGFDAASE